MEGDRVHSVTVRIVVLDETLASHVPDLVMSSIELTLIFLSWLPDATHVPSGWKRTAFTMPVWSVNALIRFFYERSQSFTVRSSEPETMMRASGEN